MFEIRQSLGLRVPFINIYLSVAKHFSIQEKDVASGKHTTDGRMKVEDHAKIMIENGRINPEKPMIVLSSRNTLANLRCGVFIQGVTDGFIAPEGEDPAKSLRPYHILGLRKNGKLEIAEMFPTADVLAGYFWAFSGVPILWQDNLYQRMITECGDHAHIWRLPRGNHPDANTATIAQWEKVHDAFRKVLHSDRESAASLINACVLTAGLAREKGYFLHNAIGVDEEGRLLQLSSMGSLEKLGIELYEMGATRAIMVDNGGSVSAWFYPKGLQSEGIPLFSLPNHRPMGTAYMFIEVDEPRYGYFWREC